MTEIHAPFVVCRILFVSAIFCRSVALSVNSTVVGKITTGVCGEYAICLGINDTVFNRRRKFGIRFTEQMNAKENVRIHVLQKRHTTTFLRIFLVRGSRCLQQGVW